MRARQTRTAPEQTCRPQCGRGTRNFACPSYLQGDEIKLARRLNHAFAACGPIRWNRINLTRKLRLACKQPGQKKAIQAAAAHQIRNAEVFTDV